ncbi:MAG: hypothetical protein CL503_06945 [Actinobacteria bacterium]|nr:hypothetical protein [Actinomycetota bacterium]|tara:strand:- start:5491 stop:6678 length:1188 start_codon:yes stop_codon:yes gene_type:complete
MNKMKVNVLVIIFLLGFSTSLWAVAAEPDGSRSEYDEAVELESQDTQKKDVVDTPETSLEQPVESLDTFDTDNSSKTVVKDNRSDDATVDMMMADVEEVSVELDDDIIEVLEEYEGLIKRKQFTKANEVLTSIPIGALNKNQRRQKKMLNVFEKIAADQAENERQFGKDESLDQSVMKTIKRLQRQAKVYILEGRTVLPRDLLIQSLYLDRKNYLSKQLLDRCLQLPLGSYQVENIEKKYWNNSLIELRSGFPSKSVDSLQMLANFDPENPMIFERMGSAFYMSGQVKKAVEAWKRALYLSPERNDLKEFIVNAEKEVERQEKLSKAYFDSKKKKSDTGSVQSDVPMQVLRVVNDSNTAFSYAQEVRQQLGKGVNVVVEELDNGKWAVKVPIKKK